MNRFFDYARERTVNKALADAVNLNDFPLSHLVQVLPDFFPDEFDRIIGDVQRTLGDAAYRGTIYVETMSTGNVVTSEAKPLGEPIPPYRVNIEDRAGRPVRAAYAMRSESSVPAFIANFPDDTAQRA